MIARLSCLALILTFAPIGFAQEAKPAPRPKVEVVFCLDTTGSMGGLIQAAKSKIWYISNQIASGSPTPLLKVGLVGFRDRGDEYITKIFDLTEDLDAIHGHLQAFKAAGGGDFPESVNQALHESVAKINWSKDEKTLKIIFLVGDAPPHMDYADDVKYPETCKLAVKNSIIINTIQCGNHAETRKYWQEICRLAEGSYVQIDQEGGPAQVVSTPFDADLGKINREISGSTLVWGRLESQRDGKEKADKNAGLAPAAAADRAGFLAQQGAATSYDFLQNIKEGKVKLEEVKKEELPPEMQKMTIDEQRAFLKKCDERRAELKTQAIELDRKRSAFIAQKQAENQKNRQLDSFDQNVFDILRRQAARANIEYKK